MVKVRVRYLLLAILVVFCGVPAFLFSFTGETARINEQILQLREALTKNGDEPASAEDLRAQNICRLFTAPCRIAASVYNIARTYRSNEEVGPSVVAALAPYSRIDIGIYDVNVTEIRQDQADARFTVSIDFSTQNGPLMTETHEIACRMKKAHNRWLFSEIRTVNVLER